MPRRRLSSDGLHLFRLAYLPPKQNLRNILNCLFRTDYDDRLDDMTKQCLAASKQLYAFEKDPLMRPTINNLIDNSMFNVIYSILLQDGENATRFEILRNYRYFMDVMEQSYKVGDHNTAILIRASLQHFSLSQLNLKLRKKDKRVLNKLAEEYGTWRNNYKQHLYKAMKESKTTIIPSLMVMKMHVARHRAYSTIERCALKFTPKKIESRIQQYADVHGEKSNTSFPLYETPESKRSEDLIRIARAAV